MAVVTLAYKTMKQIDDCIAADQGSSFRGWLGKVMPHMTDAYRTGEDGHRSHLGASIIGGECARAIWYSFRWATKSKFSARILRLFNRGHQEEARFIAQFLMIGCEVFQQDANGNQFRISASEGHFGGSGDGVVNGLPDLHPGTSALAEFKTHGDTSFVELAGKLVDWRKHLEDPVRNPFTGKGVREAKFEHFVQMQVYMRKMGLAVAIYGAVNKNTDDTYFELVLLNPELADQYIARGDKLVWLDTPPAKLNASPGFFKCRFCDHRPVCHLGAAPDVNCRTCRFSDPIAGAQWHCRKHDAAIDKPTQLSGCRDYARRTEF